MLTQETKQKEGEREREKQFFEQGGIRKKKKDRQKDVAKDRQQEIVRDNNKSRSLKQFTARILYQKVYTTKFILKMFIWKSLYSKVYIKNFISKFIKIY